MKKVVITILAILLVVGISIFAVKSCTTRKKIVTEESEIHNAFINANIEFTCTLIKDPVLALATQEAQDYVKDVYRKHKLPVDDDAAMFEILEKYSTDDEVIKKIKEGTANCETYAKNS
ncbi:MAG: hypothetical protein AAB373_02005 [Patescibacteria group bacterium]